MITPAQLSIDGPNKSRAEGKRPLSPSVSLSIGQGRPLKQRGWCWRLGWRDPYRIDLNDGIQFCVLNWGPVSTTLQPVFFNGQSDNVPVDTEMASYISVSVPFSPPPLSLRCSFFTLLFLNTHAYKHLAFSSNTSLYDFFFYRDTRNP